MSYKGVVSEEDDGLLKGGVIAIVGGGDDRLVEDRVGQDVDQQHFSLGDGETEEVDGDLVCRGVQDRGHIEWRRGRIRGRAFYPYQPEFSALDSDCFRISFQSGAVFCSSQEMRGFPCQETANRTPELEFNVYHKT